MGRKKQSFSCRILWSHNFFGLEVFLLLLIVNALIFLSWDHQMVLKSTSQCICNFKLEMLSLFWRFHSWLCPATWSATSDVFSCMELPRGGQVLPRPTIQACSTAFYCLVLQVAGQFPFPLLSQKGCFFPRKSHRIKSKTSPENAGWDPGVSSPSPARFCKFRLLCNFCPHLFSVLGKQAARSQG